MGEVSVSGGADGIRAKLDDMETYSERLDAIAETESSAAATAGKVAVSGDLVQSAVLSPGTAAQAEAAILTAATSLTLAATGTTLAAVFLRGAVSAYELTDKALSDAVDLADDVVGYVVGKALIPAALVIIGTDYVAGAFGGKSGEDRLKDQLDWLADQAKEHPDVVEHLVNGLDGTLRGVDDVLTDVVSVVSPLAGTTLSLALAASGLPWPPQSFEDTVDLILRGGEVFDAFDDGGDPVVTPADEIDAEEPIVPHSLPDLLDGSTQIDKFDDGDSFARIRVVTVDGDPPRHIVQIPSTQSWDVDGGVGNTPNDVVGDVRMMAGQDPAITKAVREAMTQAGVGPNDPVMLEGFSLGGIAAAEIAADPNSGFNVTHVVTAGAPVGNFDVPDDVSVLSVEHTNDLVPQLDGTPNPAGHNWTTVQAPGGADEPGEGHNAQMYHDTMADALSSGDPSVDAFADSARDYFSSQGTSSVRDYSAVRGE